MMTKGGQRVIWCGSEVKILQDVQGWIEQEAETAYAGNDGFGTLFVTRAAPA